MRSEVRRRSSDWLSLGLLLLMFMASGMGLVAADWADHLVIVPAVGILGVLAGTLAAISLFRGRWAAGFLAVYGVFAVGWQVGQVLDPGLTWRVRILDLLGRLGSFTLVVVRGESNADPLVFVLLVAGFYWLMGAVAAWVVFRQRGLWGAVLPAGLALLLNAFYSIGRAGLNWYLAVYVLLTLLLTLRLNVARRRKAWQAMWAQLPPNVAHPIGRAGVIAALVLVGLAWGGPAFAQSEAAARMWTQISRPWAKLRDRIGDVLGELRSPIVEVSDYYGDSLTLGAGVEPADTLVMYVAPHGETEARFYWRAHTYDRYQDGRWSSTSSERADFDPQDGDLALPPYAGREIVEFTFTPHVPALRVLNVPSQPVWISRPAEITLSQVPAGGVDVSTVEAETVVVEGETYRVRASLAVPAADQLRQAGTTYPDWVTRRYLELPPSITTRTQELARLIVTGLETPYDQALAITRWLRANLEYRRVIETPPPDAEPIDWVLFDYRLAFCDYYASAEVIMLRSLGIPARMAAGYAAGAYRRESGTYEVRGGDAHAWPEVFFPGYGWVEFEPTSDQPPLVRPEAPGREEAAPGGLPGAGGDLREGFQEGRLEEEFFQGQEPVSEESAGAAPSRPGPTLWIALAVASAAVAGVAIWFWADPYWQAVAFGALAKRLRQLGVQPPPALARVRPMATTAAAQAYFRWSLWLGRMNLPLTPAQTPFERAEVFASRMPAGGEAAWILVRAYAGERFGSLPADDDAVRQAWRSLWPQVWLAWVRRWVEPLRETSRRGPSHARPQRRGRMPGDGPSPGMP